MIIPYKKHNETSKNNQLRANHNSVNCEVYNIIHINNKLGIRMFPIVNNNNIPKNNNFLQNQTTTIPRNYLSKQSIQNNTDKLASKKINIVATGNTIAQDRKIIGGKAVALYRMQNAGMMVPEFTTVNVNDIANLEQQILDITSLQPFIINITNFNLPIVNIVKIKHAITSIYANDQEQRNNQLQNLANFIKSDAFYNQINNCQAACAIRENYNKLIAHLPEESAIIVRSSGIKEDNYGDAQAGKYDSIVHGSQDILKTCLLVLASGLQLQGCQFTAPKPMALIMQRCIDCSFGGVAMSRTSQNDSRCKIEYVQGQPRGGVSGLAGVTPHSYLVSQHKDSLVTEFTPGNVTIKFILNQRDSHNFSETQVALKANSTDINLTDTQLKQIYRYLQQGEDILLCPADIEFAIAKDGSLYVVQLRPLTVLTGGVDYAIEPPAAPIATGTLVSEGFCSGKLHYVKTQQDADTIEQGAIIVAKHGENWMLENDFLQKAVGFIFEQGGTNDHVAITLRQREKPYLIVKENFSEVKKNNNTIVSIACCNFNGESGAYLVSGSEFAEKLATMKSVIKLTHDNKPLFPTIKKQPKLKFNQPDIAFNNLSKLNYKLLKYFNDASWLSTCFSKKGILLLSMAPHRITIIKESQQEIAQMFADFKMFLSGYKQFLLLGINQKQNNGNLEYNLSEAEQITDIFQQIKIEINASINDILQQFIVVTDSATIKGNFNKLLEDAAKIFSRTQKLIFPKNINDINSIHDCIFWIHKEFIANLADVTINSKCGDINNHKKVTSISFSNAKKYNSIASLCAKSLQKLESRQPHKLVVMKNAIIALIDLGAHACTIEMLDQTATSKGKTLKLKFSDNFITDIYYQGKLKRFWLLIHILAEIGFFTDTDGITPELDHSTGTMLIEISHIKNKQLMLDKFLKLISALGAINNLDIELNRLYYILEYPKQKWDFSVLKQYISNIASVENQHYFNHLFVILGCYVGGYIFDHIKNIDGLTHQLNLIKKIRFNNNLNITEISNLINNIDGINQQQLLLDLFKIGMLSVIKLAKIEYPEFFNDKQVVIGLMNNDKLRLHDASTRLQNDLDVVTVAIKNEGINVLKYANIQLKSDPKLMLHLSIKLDIKALSYAEGNAKKNEDMLLEVIKYNAYAFDYISTELKENKNFILQAIKAEPQVYRFIGESYKQDATIIQAYEKAINQQNHNN